MPRNESKKVRGVWERTPDSGVWWIRYRVRGILKREKAGTKIDAINLLMKRKGELTAETAKNDALLQSPLRFNTLCDDILDFSKRHTFCSRLAMRGHNLKLIQQLAGHKSIEMSARYAHLGENSLHAAVDRLRNLLAQSNAV